MQGRRSITHAKKTGEKELAVAVAAAGVEGRDAIRERASPVPSSFRPRGQVELQPIRQVGTHKACTREGEQEKTEADERENRARRDGDETRDANPHDKLHRPVMLIAHLKARLQNKLLEGESEREAERRGNTKRLFHIYTRAARDTIDADGGRPPLLPPPSSLAGIIRR